MVTEANENMNKMFQTVSDNVGATIDAGVSAQRAWTEAFGDCFKNEGGYGSAFSFLERSAKQIQPLVSRNVETMTEFFETSMKNGMSGFKAACDVVKDFNADGFGEKSREAYDTNVEAARKTFDALAQAQKQAVEHWSTFCAASFGKTGGQRPVAKPSK